MPYAPLQYDHISDAFLKEEVFRRADWLLRDVYGMFALPPASLQGAGGGNWAIALVLLCVIDGLSVHVYPTSTACPIQEKRFKRLVREKLHWTTKPGWYDKSKAAAVMYTEFRNPLVHELAADKAAKARPVDYKESAVGKWGFVGVQDIDAIETMSAWNDKWPTLGVENYDGGQRLKLSCAGLYWSVKKMANELALDATIVASASRYRQNVSTRPSLLARIRHLVGR
jgi:hypothetical protein